ncbi:hypothetical protein ACFSSA_06660 [Luteolibacter algae]|uniref:Lipoprotein n=1 Tax=Luteolibacter algae TaxID=454151 RepID=A0ABW5D5J7_9BACT
MTKQVATITLGAAMILTTSCHTKNVSVGVENARFQHGYLNSKLLNQGSLLLWDMEATSGKMLTNVPHPDTSNNDNVSHASGSELMSKASSGVTVSGEIPIQQVPVGVSSEINRQTSIVVKNFESRRYYDPRFILNERDFASQRTELGEEFADNDKIRFIFIAGSTVSDDTDISIGTPTGKTNEHKLTIAGKEYKLTYSGTKEYQWKGSKQPVFVQPRIYKLIKDNSGDTGFRFVEDRQIEGDITKMLTSASSF